MGARELLPSVDPASPLAAVLEREAKALARLDHDGIVGLLDLQPADGSHGPRLLFDDPGPTLAAWLARAKGAPREPSDGRDRDVPPEEAMAPHANRPSERAVLAVGLLIARALGHAHRLGVVHGHLRAACVGLGPGGRIRLFDFTRAVIEGEDPPAAHELSVDDELVAPELQRGISSPAADVFALGVLLHELAALDGPGQPPHALKVLPPSLRGSAIEAVLRRALAPDPAARFADGAALAEHLARLVGSDDDARDVVAALVDPSRPDTQELAAAATPPLRGPLAPLVGLSAVMLLGLVAIDVLWRAPPPVADAGPPLGSVTVLARPWADVQLDGKRLDTTPIGRPVVLPAGRHDFLFTHPAAPDERRTVQLGAGELLTLKVEMRVVRPVAPKSGATAEEQP